MCQTEQKHLFYFFFTKTKTFLSFFSGLKYFQEKKNVSCLKPFFYFFIFFLIFRGIIIWNTALFFTCETNRFLFFFVRTIIIFLGTKKKLIWQKLCKCVIWWFSVKSQIKGIKGGTTDEAFRNGDFSGRASVRPFFNFQDLFYMHKNISNKKRTEGLLLL